MQMLEELCRALASSTSTDLGVFWEELLGGPLTAVLQDYSEHEALSAQACGVLATMSSHSMATMKASTYNVCVRMTDGWPCGSAYRLLSAC